MLWYVKISIVEGKEIVIVNVRNLTDFGCPLRSTWEHFIHHIKLQYLL